jgi:DNA-binding GntR family transcriptional regulator
VPILPLLRSNCTRFVTQLDALTDQVACNHVTAEHGIDVPDGTGIRGAPNPEEKLRVKSSPREVAHPMPRRYGIKDKDRAAEYVVEQVLSGKLRSGDRVDRTQLAAALGMSRVPVQEAMVQLETEGILRSEYHRGVFVERFDEGVVKEHFEVFSELSAIASERAAVAPSADLLAALKEALDLMVDAQDVAAFEYGVWSFRRAVNREAGGPRLLAAIRMFQSFIPTAFWSADDALRETMLPPYRREYLAIRRRDPAAARRAVIQRAERMADVTIRELIQRGVLESPKGARRADR